MMNLHFIPAYIDPSSTTILLQAAVGVAVAVGAVITVWWRKAKKKVTQKLGIDESAKKQNEADVTENDEDDE